MSTERSVMQRSPAIRVPHLDVRAMFQQRAGDFNVVFQRRIVQWSGSGSIPGVYIRAWLHQHLHEIHLALDDRFAKQVPAPQAWARCKQRFHRTRTIQPRRLLERDCARIVLFLAAVDREGLRQDWKAYAPLPTAAAPGL